MQNEDIRYEEGGLVAKAYEEDNYIIRRYENDSNTVAVYFSSNGIYYPNTGETFRKRILEENRYYDMAELKRMGYTFPDTWYFYSGLCEADRYQSELMKKADDGHIRMFEFNTSTHERTMFVFNLPEVLGRSAEELDSLYSYYKGRRILRTDFSINVSGISGTVRGAFAKAARKLHINNNIIRHGEKKTAS